MLVLTQCRFIATPKTGSQWCHAALRRACDVQVDWAEPKNYHTSLFASPAQYLPAIAFVRRPVPWYVSYWRHRMMHGWKPETERLDEHCRSDSFAEFAENVVEKFPGWLSDALPLWCGPERLQAAFVGRYESLEDDLVRALRQVEEPFDEDALRSTPPTNVGDSARFPVEVPDELACRIEDAERVMLDRFYGGVPCL